MICPEKVLSLRQPIRGAFSLHPNNEFAATIKDVLLFPAIFYYLPLDLHLHPIPPIYPGPVRMPQALGYRGDSVQVHIYRC